jgi:putative hydrolase of the HAD superfamily
MNSKKYSVIVFDLGNVLIPFDYNLMLDKLNQKQSGLGKKFHNYYKDNYEIHRDFERGKIAEKDFLSRMLGVLNSYVSEEEFCNYYSKIFSVNEDVASLLPVLKEKYILVLLSNTNSIHRKYGWDDYSFLKYFDKLILSYEVGAVKPENKIYLAVEEFTQKPSGEHLFIDDIKEYVQGAKNIGWDAVHFTGYQKLLEELKGRKIL